MHLTIDLSNLTVEKLILILGITLSLGVINALTFVFTHRKTYYEQSFKTTILLLPVIIAMIIILVNDQLAAAFSLTGIFALVRFRMAISDSKDITYILSSVASGLAIALGYVTVAYIFVAVFALVLVILDLIKFEVKRNKYYKIKVLISESLNYQDVFEDLFNEYLTSNRLVRVKTTDFGTLFELSYLVSFKDTNKIKEFLDQIRIRNGNLNITLYDEYNFSKENLFY